MNAPLADRDKGQPETSILGPKLTRNPSKSAAGGSKELIFLTFLVMRFTLHCASRIASNPARVQVFDSASRTGGTLLLFQTAQRSASGA